MSTSLINAVRRSAPLILFLAFVAITVLMPHTALANTADTSSGGLPWESPLKTLRESFSGPVAFAISLIGIIVCGCMLIWGGEINEFARRMIMVVLVVAVIVLANSLLTGLFTNAETLTAPATYLKHVTHDKLSCIGAVVERHCMGFAR
jgi:type IV secretory pathway VirB2 component (pilin)